VPQQQETDMTTWADQFNTYQEACDFYGCDGPREFAFESRYEAEREAEEAAAFIGPKLPPELGFEREPFPSSSDPPQGAP
jgi:hypothetical protein